MFEKLIIFFGFLTSAYFCCIATQIVEVGEPVSTTGVITFETSTRPIETTTSVKSTTSASSSTRSTSTSTTTSTTTTTTTTTTTVPLVLGCLSGWTKFNRGTYYWCMKVYWGYTTGPIADSLCRSLNSTAVCSGFQNKQELLTMTATAYSEVKALRRLYLGLKRTTACWTAYLSSKCNALNSFYWTDGHTTGTAGFKWRSGTPDT